MPSEQTLSAPAAPKGIAGGLLLATLGAIAVGHDALGKPLYLLDAPLAAHLASLGLRAHLSISDEAEYAVAYVILEQA